MRGCIFVLLVGVVGLVVILLTKWKEPPYRPRIVRQNGMFYIDELGAGQSVKVSLDETGEMKIIEEVEK